MTRAWFVFIIGFISCQKQLPADLIVLDGNIYSADADTSFVSAMAVRGGKIIFIGDSTEALNYMGDQTELFRAQGKFIMPGFIEGHGHFAGLGGSLINLNFIKTKSWDEIVAMVAEKAKTAKPGEWIIGRGWHQEKWTQPLFASVHGYPLHDALSEVSPDNPVLLSHASGHGSFVNAKAMQLAGVTKETPDPKGGTIVRDAQGNAIGMFEERAQGIIRQAYNIYLKSLPPDQLEKIWHDGIVLAQEECLKKGVTSFQDAGSSFQEMEWYKVLAEQNKLKIRLWAMLRHSSKDLTKDALRTFPWIGLGNDHFTMRSVKSDVDGALGSYGAWLLAPYTDRQDIFYGQNTTEISEVSAVAQICMDHGLQLCVHAIGDRANREVLDLMQTIFNAHPDKQDLRWRIEHAQHLDTADIPRFGKLGVIAAMQGIHCTSDAPFVVKRLGAFRSQTGAYAWKSLLNSGAVVTNGTDAPVEDVDPLSSFYASVTRKRSDYELTFFPEQSMTRHEAIKSYTLAAAYSAFEDHIKGSLTPGKWADFIMLSNDLIHCGDAEILNTEVLKTWVGGKLVYSKE